MSPPILRLATSQRAVFLINSRLGRFTAAYFHSTSSPKLRSHFAEFLSYSSLAHLRILSSSPMCVHFRYGYILILLEAFLGSLLQWLLYLLSLSIRFTPSYFEIRICLNTYYLACTSSSIRWLHLAFSVTPSLNIQYRNFCLLSIDYAFRPRLRSRLTQSGRTFLWKPWVFGAWDSHPRSATHTGISTSKLSTYPLDYASPTLERSPTNSISTIP